MHRFEWNYNEIKDQHSFADLIEWIKTFGSLVNYEQAARLFYAGKYRTVMIELQFPTRELIDLIEHDVAPWFDVYEVENMEDYNAEYEIHTTIDYPQTITFDNAENLMLELARRLCD